MNDARIDEMVPITPIEFEEELRKFKIAYSVYSYKVYTPTLKEIYEKKCWNKFEKILLQGKRGTLCYYYLCCHSIYVDLFDTRKELLSMEPFVEETTPSPTTTLPIGLQVHNQTSAINQALYHLLDSDLFVIACLDFFMMTTQSVSNLLGLDYTMHHRKHVKALKNLKRETQKELRK